MLSKNKKKLKGPTWLEVGMGAALSVVLGVIVGAFYMVSKPVQVVRDIPKDAPSGAVYYIEGSKDSNKSAAIEGKRREFTQGLTVAVSEGELNALIASLSTKAPAAPAKPGDKAAPPPANQKAIDPGTLNVRIHAGKIQFGNPVSYNIYGFTGSIIVQASGTFEKHGGIFTFEPDVIYVGGCPVQRFIGFGGWIMNKLLFAQPIPDDIATAWSKLTDVALEGSTLRLKTP